MTADTTADFGRLRELHRAIDTATEALAAFTSLTREGEPVPASLLEAADEVVPRLASWREGEPVPASLLEAADEVVPRLASWRARLRPVHVLHAWAVADAEQH